MKDQDMGLIDRYVLEVESYLPRDLRHQVTEDLRSDLTRKLEARKSSHTEEPDMDLEVEILRELGPPYEFADSHVPRPRVLFGPRLYPPFIRTMQIAVLALSGLAILGLVFDFIQTQSLFRLGGSLLSALTNVLTGSVVILGITVVVFAIIERTAGATPRTPEDWDPRSLPKDEDPDKISLGDEVASVAFLVVALVVLNFFRHRIGAHLTMDGEVGWVPWLGPAFEAHLWLLNVALAADLGVHFLVLWQRRWSWTLRWSNFAVSSLYLVWLWFLVSGPPFLGIDTEWMIQHGWSAESASKYKDFVDSNFGRWMSVNTHFVFWIACFGLGCSLFKLIKRWVTHR